MTYIYIKDFTKYPGLRHCSISDNSGEEYYHTILNGAFKKAYETKEILTINLDFTAGYAPSFLDEAFGNLIYDFGLEIVKKHLKIISTQEPDLEHLIINETFPQWDTRKKNGQKPKKTNTHDSWYKLDNGIITSTNNEV